jgi:hypothetical protein
MADINKIRTNIKKMVAMDATENDINDYISSEGVSIDEINSPVEKRIKKSGMTEDEKILTGLGTAAAVGAGAIGFGVHQFNAPARQMKIREKELDNIKVKYLQTPYVASQDVPSRIKDKLQVETQPLKTEVVSENVKLKNTRVDLQQAQRNLNRSLDDFDNQILTKSSKEMADSLLQNQDKFFEDTYKNYGQVIDLAEEKLTKAGKQIDSEAFIQSVIDKSIQDATAEGLPPDKMGRINSFKAKVSQQLESAILDDESRPFILKKPITVRQAKGLVGNLAKGAPKELAMSLRENWGSLLQQYPDVAADIGSANKDYKEFAKIRRAIYKTIDESGKYSPQRLHKMMYAYAKANTETGLQEMVNLMAKGQGIVGSVPEVGTKFKALEGTKIAREAMQKAGVQQQVRLERVISDSTRKSGDLSIAIEKAREKAISMGNRAEQLLSEQKNIETKHPIRSGGITKALGKVVGIGRNAAVASVARRTLGSIAIYPMISAAVNGFSDPKKFIADQIGVDLPERGTKDRAVLESFMEKQLAPQFEGKKGNNLFGKEPTPEELGVSPEEEFQILLKYGLAA